MTRSSNSSMASKSIDSSSSQTNTLPSSQNSAYQSQPFVNDLLNYWIPAPGVGYPNPYLFVNAAGNVVVPVLPGLQTEPAFIPNPLFQVSPHPSLSTPMQQSICDPSEAKTKGPLIASTPDCAIVSETNPVDHEICFANDEYEVEFEANVYHCSNNLTLGAEPVNKMELPRIGKEFVEKEVGVMYLHAVARQQGYVLLVKNHKTDNG
ncbi:hypothetical protein DFH28DRAFT_936367 [Melampsora americana]|nr:hypothetical protein DFH28DRAFT_936367 [Melampsora americana]